MKKIYYLFSMLICSAITIHAQNKSGEDSTGLPGDNFSLQGALQMFQNASSPEDFEKAINTQGNGVNNLDLNGDGDIDYISVIDKSQGNSHVFVLQVPVSDNESQDIAVIELEKTGDTTAVLQIIGDEDIYGEQVIVEPDTGDADAFNDSYDNNNLTGPNYNYEYNFPAIVINVWRWPCVRFVYASTYTLWASPWRWHRYPGWWHPWRPLAWHVWHPLRLRYHRGFALVHTHRVIHAHAIYTPFRRTSVIVRNRHSAVVGHYRGTRTTIIRRGPAGKVRTIGGHRRH